MSIFLIIVTCLITSFAHAQYAAAPNYIEVTGKSEMELTPDEIYLKIVINENDIKGRSLEETEQLMISKLKENGIDVAKDLTIKDFLSKFRNYFVSKTAIHLAKEYQLLVHDAKTADKVFTELQKIGVSNLSVDKIDHSRRVEYGKEIKVNAIKAAQEKAKALAQTINQDIGRAIFIQEEHYNVNPITSNSIVYEKMQSETPMGFDKIHLEYSILVRFELK